MFIWCFPNRIDIPIPIVTGMMFVYKKYPGITINMLLSY